MRKMDFNSDVGEGIGNDSQLMPYLSSCSIACGAHAGSKEIIRATVNLALRHEVKIGAHPSYPDPKNFGRVVQPMSITQLSDTIKRQITLVKQITLAQGGTLSHIKPHGALYNQAAVDARIANCIINCVLEVAPECSLYVPYQSVIAQEAKEKLDIKKEGFADRNYHNNYSLVARSLPEAVIRSPQEVWDHVSPMLTRNELTTIEGKTLAFELETLCFHGDHPNAVAILQYVHHQCLVHQIAIV